MAGMQGSDAPMKFSFVPYNIYFTDSRYNHVRRATVINFGKDLMEVAEVRQLTQPQVIELLQKLEKGCYRAAIGRAKKMQVPASWESDAFTEIYGERAYNLIQNLKPDSSVGRAELLRRILAGSVDAVRAADLSPQELCPELYAELAEPSAEEIKAKANSLYTCKNCGTSGVHKENCYNRSFDESVTHRLTCLTCGTCWNE